MAWKYAVLAGILGMGVAPPAAYAQNPAPPEPASYPACVAPPPGQYMLLVHSPTPQSQQQVQQVVPPSLNQTLCAYGNQVMTRVGNFRTQEATLAWVKYFRETQRLQAFAVRATPDATTPVATPVNDPATAPSPPATGTPTPAEMPDTPAAEPARDDAPLAYAPQTLAAGYAVLIDFRNDPAIARQLSDAIQQPVALVVYRQRPYLLALQTTDQQAAGIALQALSDRGFLATLVESQQVILLRAEIDTAGLATTTAEPE